MSSASQLVGIPELVLHCLASLEPSRYDDTSVKTLVSCSLVSRALGEVARTDSLWLAHYRARYTRMWKDEGASEEWNKRYAARRLVDLHVLSLLNTIITTPSKRGASIVEINKLGDGAWHVLSSEAACAVPPQLRNVCAKGDRKWKCERWESIVDQWDDSEFAQTDEETYGREVGEDWIQRRWWAKQALGTMARASAVQKMAQVFRGPQPDPSTTENAEAFEEGLKAFSGLMGVNTAEISRNYDLLASTCARDLGSNGICVDPLSGEFDLEAFSAGVCAWMASKGFKRAAEGQYYNLMNHFPHTFMTTNRATLPMSLVCTFVAIVTRLGLRSSPVGFPGHVHAWIALPHPEPSSGVEDDQPPRQLAVDVFHYARQPFLTPEEMRLKLVSLGVPEGQQRTLMGPAVASEMILRAANNILHSVTRVHDQVTTSLSPETRGAALYAAAVAFLIARPEAADATQFIGGVISVVKEQCPLDTEPVLAQELSRVLDRDPFQSVGMHLRMAVGRLRESEARIVTKRRTEGNVRWWAGLIFRHAKFHYTGVILGWDYKCMAGEDWIRDVGVDMLPRGRDQPFYPIMGADGSSRYVAEENIIPLPALATETDPEYKVDWDVIRALMQEASSSIEPVFSRIEVNEELGRAWFVPSFVRTEVNPQSYTLVSLNGADTLRCHNISSSTLSALRESFGNETRFFGEVGDGDVAEFVFRSNPWSTKTVRSEILIVQLFSILLQHQYTFLTTIDYGRQYLDKLSLTFTRPISTPSNTPATESVFALSFIAPTVLRVLNAPLHATPAILQSVRGAWPRGVKSERKLGDGCWEFRLKGFGYFSTEKSDEAVLPHVFGLLRTFDTHAFKLIAAVPIGGRSRSKDLWLFTAPGTSKPSPSNQGTTSPSPYQQTLESDTAYSPGPFTASPTVGTGHGKFATDEPEKNLPIAAAHSRSASAPGPHRKPVPMPVPVVAQPVPPVANPPMTMPVPMHVAPHPSTPPRNKLSTPPRTKPSTPPRTKPSTPPRTKPSTPPGAKPPSPLSSSQPAPVPVSIPPKRNSSLLRKFRASSGGAGRTASGRFRHPPPPPALAPNGTGSHARNGSLASGEIIYETPKPGQGQEPVQVPESPVAQTPLTPLAPVPPSPRNDSPTSPVSPGFVAPPPPPPLPNASPVQDAYPSPVESRPTNPSTEELLLSRGAFRDSAFSGSTDTSHDVDILWTGTAPLVKAPAEQLADVKEGEEEVERSPDLVRTMHEDARPKSERAEVALAVPASEIPPVPKLDQERPGMPVPSQSGTPNEWVFVSVDKPKTTGTDSSASSPPPKVDPETPMLEPETPATAISRTGSFRRWFGSTQKSTTSKKGKPKRRRGMTPAIRSSKRLTIE